MRSHARRNDSGFTLIELMVVIAIAGVLLALAAPSFRGFFAKKRVEGVATELGTDLQYARSESVARNAGVTVTFGTHCYVIHLASATSAACTQATKGIVPASAEIKTVQMNPGWGIGLTASASPIVFDPVRGVPSSAVSIDLANSVGGSWKLRTSMSLAGRTSVCSPNSSLAGYSSC